MSASVSFICWLFRINQVFYLIFVNMKFSMDKLKDIDRKRIMVEKLRKAVAKKPCTDLSVVTWASVPWLEEVPAPHSEKASTTADEEVVEISLPSLPVPALALTPTPTPTQSPTLLAPLAPSPIPKARPPSPPAQAGHFVSKEASPETKELIEMSAKVK